MTDNTTMLDVLNDAIMGLSLLMDDLRDIPECKEWVDALGDIQSEMQKEYEVREASAETEHQQELAEMMRDYWRDQL